MGLLFETLVFSPLIFADRWYIFPYLLKLKAFHLMIKNVLAWNGMSLPFWEHDDNNMIVM